jgi:8-oxo-dGTP pyrophosphatase MutT (NUDIX family)
VLQRGLPGPSAQRFMAPAGRVVGPFEEKDYPDARKASVMVLLYSRQDEVRTVLMERPSYDGVHSGQISFPGGGQEQQDADAWQTAQRETMEEVGVTDIQLIGPLSPLYIPPSNFFVRPFLGWLPHEPVFVPDEQEVASIVEFPVHDLLLPSVKSTMMVERKDWRMEVPCYLIGGHQVWGATAIILSELEALLEKMDE